MSKYISLKKFNIPYTIAIVFVLSISVIGSTYAYFALSSKNNTAISGTSATTNLTLSVTKLLPTTTSYLVPQISVDSNGNKILETALKRKCIDDNNNAVCEVYKITIANDSGTANEVVNGYLSFYSDSAYTKNSYTTMPNLRWRLISSYNETTPSSSTLGDNTTNTASSTNTAFMSNLTLSTSSTNTYYIIIWFEEIGTDQIDKGNTYYGKVEIKSSSGEGLVSTF